MNGNTTKSSWYHPYKIILLPLVFTLGIASILATGGNGNGDDKPGTLQFSSATYSGNESAGTISVSITRINGSEGAASVEISDTGNGSATPGSDYTAITTTTLNWGDDDAGTKTFDITIMDDSIFEVDKTVILELGNASGASLGTPATTTVTIVDDDAVPGILQFSSATYSGNEDAGNITVTVTRTGGSDGAASVQLSDTNSGSATSGTDYDTIATTTLNWTNGDATAKTIDVVVTADGTVESDETVSLVLANATGASLGSPTAATVTIVNDDAAVPGSLQFSQSNYTVAEDGSGTATITVTRTGGSAGLVGVTYATSDGSAANGSDYTGVSNTLSWADGISGPQTFDVAIINDTEVEVPETVNLALSLPTGGANLGIPATATLTITSEDKFGTIGFKSLSYNVNEADGTVSDVIALERVDGSSGLVTVDVDDLGTGSASSGTDYNAIPTTEVAWPDGDTTDKYLTITLNNDSDTEGTETIDLSLSSAGGGATIGTNDKATVNIADDDIAAPGELQFDSDNYTVNEDAGTATITVNRINGTSGEVAATYATSDGSASAGSDYAATTGPLVWANGIGGGKTFTVSINEDAEVEGDETITLTLSAATGGAAIVGTNPVTLTIADNDTNLSMNIGQGGKWVAFQDGPAGDWIEWSPTSGNTYDFPVTDSLGRYGVAIHHEESDGTFSAHKTYIIHATLSELSSLNVFPNPSYSVSGTLSNRTGSNDSSAIAVFLAQDGGSLVSDPYPYILPRVSAGDRDLLAIEWIDATDAMGNFVRRVVSVNDNLTNQDVDFANDGEPLTLVDSEFHGGSGSTGQYLEVYYATTNGTVILIAEGEYDGSTALLYPYFTNAAMTVAGDGYSFQNYKSINLTQAKYRIRNRVANSTPLPTQSFGLGSLLNLSGTGVTNTGVTGLSYTPDIGAFAGDPVFRGFQIDLDQTQLGVDGGSHWQIKVSKGWLGTSTSYNYPALQGINGYNNNWNLADGVDTDARVTALTTNSSTGLGLIYRKTLGRNSNNLTGNIADKLAQNNSLRLDMAHESHSLSW